MRDNTYIGCQVLIAKIQIKREINNILNSSSNCKTYNKGGYNIQHTDFNPCNGLFNCLQTINNKLYFSTCIKLRKHYYNMTNFVINAYPNLQFKIQHKEFSKFETYLGIGRDDGCIVTHDIYSVKISKLKENQPPLTIQEEV